MTDPITITLPRFMWEALTRKLRAHNAKNIDRQVQLGPQGWQTVAAIEGECQTKEAGEDGQG